MAADRTAPPRTAGGVDDRPPAPGLRRLVRAVSLALGGGLVAWALSDHDWISGGPGFGWTEAAVLAAGLALAASALAPFSWNARLLALALSTAFALGAAEAVLRAFLAPRFVTAFRASERNLYELVPGARREFRRTPANGGERIRYRINSDGFRGAELDRDPELRVVVYGDSFVQGEYSADPDTFAARLEHHLAERLGSPVEVVNAGVAGYGPDQELRKMEDELPRLEPELVVVVVYAGNDFGDLVRNKIYRLEDGRLVENRFRVSAEIAQRMQRARSEPILKRIAREAGEALLGRGAGPFDPGLEARRARMESFLAQGEDEYRQAVVDGDPVVRELMRDPYNADVSLLPDGDSARYKRELMDHVLARMKQVTDQHGVPLALVFVPHPIDVHGEHEVGAVDRAKYPAYRPTALTDALEAIAERHGIAYVNLFEPYRERGPGLYFREADDHWNDLGQDVAGAVVAESLVERGLVGAPGAASARANR